MSSGAGGGRSSGRSPMMGRHHHSRPSAPPPEQRQHYEPVEPAPEEPVTLPRVPPAAPPKSVPSGKSQTQARVSAPASRPMTSTVGDDYSSEYIPHGVTARVHSPSSPVYASGDLDGEAARGDFLSAHSGNSPAARSARNAGRLLPNQYSNSEASDAGDDEPEFTALDPSTGEAVPTAAKRKPTASASTAGAGAAFAEDPTLKEIGRVVVTNGRDSTSLYSLVAALLVIGLGGELVMQVLAKGRSTVWADNCQSRDYSGIGLLYCVIQEMMLEAADSQLAIYFISLLLLVWAVVIVFLIVETGRQALVRAGGIATYLSFPCVFVLGGGGFAVPAIALPILLFVGTPLREARAARGGHLVRSSLRVYAALGYALLTVTVPTAVHIVSSYSTGLKWLSPGSVVWTVSMIVVMVHTLFVAPLFYCCGGYRSSLDEDDDESLEEVFRGGGGGRDHVCYESATPILRVYRVLAVAGAIGYAAALTRLITHLAVSSSAEISAVSGLGRVFGVDVFCLTLGLWVLIWAETWVCATTETLKWIGLSVVLSPGVAFPLYLMKRERALMLQSRK